MDSPGVAKPVADTAPEGASTGARPAAGTVAGRLVTVPAPGSAGQAVRSCSVPGPIPGRAQATCALIRSRRQMITRKSLRKDQPITCGDAVPVFPELHRQLWTSCE